MKDRPTGRPTQTPNVERANSCGGYSRSVDGGEHRRRTRGQSGPSMRNNRPLRPRYRCRYTGGIRVRG